MPLKDDAWRLQPARYPLRLPLQTRYGDMDANAHLNNVAIARLLEEARVRFHTALKQRHPETDPVGLMIVHASIDYLGEGSYPAEVEAGVAVVAIGRSSYRLAIGLFQEGAAIALADCVMVARNREGAGAAPVGPGLRYALEAMRPR